MAQCGLGQASLQTKMCRLEQHRSLDLQVLSAPKLSVNAGKQLHLDQALSTESEGLLTRRKNVHFASH